MLIVSPSARLSACGPPPQADEPSHERDQEDLTGQHPEHGRNLANVAPELSRYPFRHVSEGCIVL
jgi:hypothetical protein